VDQGDEESMMSRTVSILQWLGAAKIRVLTAILGLSLLAMTMTACGTVTGTAVGAGSGAAIGAAAGDAKKGALIGAGVGAAGGAIYDATR
jgi:hypothetical protein